MVFIRIASPTGGSDMDLVIPKTADATSSTSPPKSSTPRRCPDFFIRETCWCESRVTIVKQTTSSRLVNRLFLDHRSLYLCTLKIFGCINSLRIVSLVRLFSSVVVCSLVFILIRPNCFLSPVVLLVT